MGKKEQKCLQKKISRNMSDYCQVENQVKGIQKKNREKLLEKNLI